MAVSSLSDTPLFGGLSAADCGAIEQRMARQDFLPQATIVREGSTGDAAYVVLSGSVAVRRTDPDSGVVFTLAELGAGQMFGEMALVTSRPRTASVVAVDATSCAVLARGDFELVMQQHPSVALAFARVLAERLERANEHAGIDFVSLSRVHVDPRVMTLLPATLVHEHKILPIAFCNNRLTLAMINPANVVAFDDVRRILKGVLIEPAVVSDEDFRRFVSKHLPLVERRDAADADHAGIFLQSDIVRNIQLQADHATQEVESRTAVLSASRDAPVIRLANSIIGLAIRQGASDIHIEPMEGEVTIRYRVDGMLQVAQRLPKKAQLGLISRLKVLSRLDIAEKRLPQDGRISVQAEGRQIDLRVSTVPGKWGEKVCLRILDKSALRLNLEQLIVDAPTLQLVREMIAQPHGMIYVTGPTGSGKTTTIYSALLEINQPSINIATAEDPVEYDLPGLTQIQVNSSIGLTFAAILRAFLRQDPDVLLVGEARDRETAQTAVEAALTGHLVLTTLHTNSAAGAFTRLGEMGIEPFLVSSSTIGVVAQRLARRLCRQCREPYEADATTCGFFDLPPRTTLFRGRGCLACGGKGVKGRVGIYEVMRITPRLRQLIAAGASSDDIHTAAIAEGMVDLKGYSSRLLTGGLSTVEEITSVVSVRP